jgi:hypothetical protein
MPREPALCNAKVIYVLCISMYYVLGIMYHVLCIIYIIHQNWVNNKTSEYIAKNVYVEKSQKCTNYLAPRRDNIPEMKTLIIGLLLTDYSIWKDSCI